jgi:4'-phosphopantetheinyl transferase EntD
MDDGSSASVDHNELFREILDPVFPVAARTPCDSDIESLHPEEQALVHNAVAARRREFATGRALARQLMMAEGIAAPLLKAPGGAPAWPRGYHGSISHCATLAAAAIGPAKATAGLGIDIEIRTPLTSELKAAILATDGERRLAEEDPDRSLWLFCAKEAAYKAIYPWLGKVIGFEAMEIMRCAESQGFDAVLRADIGSLKRGSTMRGRWTIWGPWIAAAVALPPAALAS